nr:MAG TPA: large terminase [Caudoviricetes sp.]
MWSKQAEIAKSVVENTHTAVVSCNGAGKSALAGIMGAWWVAVHDPYDIALICSAPTYPQIARVLFRELKDNHKIAAERGFNLPGHINQSEEWKLDDTYGTLIGFGRRPADTDIVSAFQGIHRRYVFVILDEAGGIPQDLYTATEAVTNTADARVLAIGNPDRRGTEFHRIFREDPTWNKIKISAYDTPNFTGEKIPEDLKPLLIQTDWVEKQKISWGEESARFKSKVLGEFPDEADNAFFSQSAIDKAIDTEIEDDAEVYSVLGVDLARFGEDDSVVYINRGGRCRKLDSWSKATAIESANRVHKLAVDNGVKEIRVDAAGLGGPVVDILANLAQDRYLVISMLGSAASPDNTRWGNARASSYDNLREGMLDGKIDIDGDDKTLLEEMLMLQYKFTPKGAIQIESKDDMRSRGVKSPDSLDSLVYATADLSNIINGPYKDKKIGDIMTYDYNELDGQFPFYSVWQW